MDATLNVDVDVDAILVFRVLSVELLLCSAAPLLLLFSLASSHLASAFASSAASPFD